MPFESSLSIYPVFEGDITGAGVQELKDSGPPEIWEMTTNVRTDQDWRVEVGWYLEGSLLSSAFFTFVGEWIVSVRLESMGTGGEHNLPEVRVSVDDCTSPSPDRREYTATIPVLAGSPGAPQADVYKVVTVITYEDPDGNPGPIAGFLEGGLLQIYAV
jgi:hypothetical protein